ncbi:MAG: hypothetical protein R2932_35100 [Caldilineaceae bacterium]
MAIQQQALTKTALEAYRSRWEAVAQIELEEKQQATIEQRWQKLNAMLRLSIALDLYEKMRAADVSDVRARWIKLKAGYK